MTKARTLANFISDGSPLADGTISVSEVSGAAPLASPTFTGTVNISSSENNIALFDGSHSTSTQMFLRNTNTGTGLYTVLGFAPSNSVSGATITTYAEEDFSEAANRTARLEIDTRDNGNWFNRLTLGRLEAVFNDDSDATDFRVESDGNANAFFVEGSTDHVGMGVLPTTSYGNVLQIHDTGTAGANLRLTDATSGSGTNNGMEIIQIGVESFVINREAGALSFFTNQFKRMQIESDGSVIINDISADADFRVESNNYSSCFKVDAGNDTININSTTLQNASLSIAAKSAGTSSNWGQGGYTNLSLAIPNVVGQIGQLGFVNDGSAGADMYCGIGAEMTSGSGVGLADLVFFAKDNGSNVASKERMRILGAAGHVVINDQSYDQDFRVESDSNANMLFVDGGNNIVSIGSGSPYQSGRLEVFAQNDLSSEGISINGASSATSFRLYTVGNVAKIGRGGDNPAISISSGNLVTINENSLDADFRVESDSNANAFVVNAGTGRVGVNNGNPTYTFEVGAGSQENMGIGWARLEYFTVGIPSSGTRWYKLANYSTGIMLQGHLFMSSARNGGAHQTNGARMQHGSLAGYNNAVNTSDWGDVGTNYGHTAYYIEVGTDDNVYLRVNGSVYTGEVYCQFQGRANWVFDGSYVTSAP